MAGRGRGQEASAKVAEESEQEEGEEEEEESEDGDGEDDREMVSYLEDPPTQEELRLLTRRMFPSKVGGRPAWLVPRGFPPEGLACQRCSRPMRFLLQIYASRGWERPSAFHRVLHVFVCTNCQPNEARVLRAQLPRQNAFYSSERPDADAIGQALREAGDRDPELDALCCEACGLPRAAGEEALCADCARLLRLGEEPAVFRELELSTGEAELLDEEEEEEAAPSAAEPQAPGAPPAASAPAAAAGHGAASGSPTGAEEVEEVYTPGAAKACGKDRDPVGEADDVIASAKAKGASEEVLQKLRLYREKLAENCENAMDASEQAAFEELAKERGEHDSVFSRFNRYAAANAGHVLRYTYGGQPLWFCKPNRLEGTPPACQRCGAERVFEFQVQPQLIALLSGSRLADRLDYGIICCYVCSGHCNAPEGGSAYLEEFVHVQPEPHDAWLPKG